MAVREKISKETILKAAEQVFSEYGFHDAKIYRIADIAGVSVGTIYRFFRSKEELYGEVIQRKLKELQKVIDQKTKNRSPEEALLKYFEATFEFFEREKDFSVLFVREVGCGAKGNLDFSEWYREHVEGLAKIVGRGIKRETFEKVNPTAAAISITGSVRDLVQARIEGSLKSQKEAVDLAKTLFLKGLKAS